MINISQRLVSALKAATASTGGFIALHEPEFDGMEVATVKACVESGFVSSIGSFVNQFEHDLAKYLETKYAVAMVNGTSALHIALLVNGVSPGDEVLMPALSFVATANAVKYCHAEPHFLDIDSGHLGLSPECLATRLDDIAERRNGSIFNRLTGRRIAAIVPVHIFGHPCQIHKILEVADLYGLPVVEDAAESLGTILEGRHLGGFGACAAISFNGNKIITTGGGGALVTNDTELARLAKHLSTTAKMPHKWQYFHDQIGYNYRMPNINAALGCAQLEKIEDFIAKKRKLFGIYSHHLTDIDGLDLLKEPDGARSNYWLHCLVLQEQVQGFRDQILDDLNKAGLMVRPVWELLHRLPAFHNNPKSDLSLAENLAGRIINIPSSARLAA